MQTAQALAAANDQYFTAPAAVTRCLELFLPIAKQALGDLSSCWFVEPSAGAGAFLNPLKQRGYKTWAGDIEPQSAGVHQHDFLSDPLPTRPRALTHTCVIGNPPFGRKSALAVAFLNRALEMSDLIGFVVPIQLRKWSAQHLVATGARLVIDELLPEDSFEFCGKPYRVRCCFQVWTRLPIEQLPGVDLRLLEKPATEHPDFQAWQYNGTPQTLKYFGRDWDYAVLRQGFGDFSRRHPKGSRLDRRKQWIFIKAGSRRALRVLRSIDYSALSKRNTGTPGFGKADLVNAYTTASRRSLRSTRLGQREDLPVTNSRRNVMSTNSAYEKERDARIDRIDDRATKAQGWGAGYLQNHHPSTEKDMTMTHKSQTRTNPFAAPIEPMKRDEVTVPSVGARVAMVPYVFQPVCPRCGGVHHDGPCRS